MTESVTAVLGGIPNADWTVERSEFSHAGLKLSYLDIASTSNADGPTVVMLHGMTAHNDSWRPMVARMKNPGRVICPDFRGHGFSDWSRDGYWLSDYVGDTIALLDHVGVSDVHIVGHSLGARVSMVLAHKLGERTKSLVLSDTGPEVSRDAAQKALSINASTKSKPGHSSYEKLVEFLWEQQPNWTEEAIIIRAATLYRKNWADMYVNRGDSEVTWLLGRAGLKEVDDMWNALGAITAPTLILQATQSFLLDDEIAGRMTAALANSGIASFDLGHYLPYEDPDAVADILDRFLEDPEALLNTLRSATSSS